MPDIKNAPSLDEMANGKLRMMFEDAWKRVAENIGDFSMSCDATRKINIAIKLKPIEGDRNVSHITCSIKTTLGQPDEAYIGSAYLNNVPMVDGNGEVKGNRDILQLEDPRRVPMFDE